MVRPSRVALLGAGPGIGGDRTVSEAEETAMTEPKTAGMGGQGRVYRNYREFAAEHASGGLSIGSTKLVLHTGLDDDAGAIEVDLVWIEVADSGPGWVALVDPRGPVEILSAQPLPWSEVMQIWVGAERRPQTCQEARDLAPTTGTAGAAAAAAAAA